MAYESADEWLSRLAEQTGLILDHVSADSKQVHQPDTVRQGSCVRGHKACRLRFDEAQRRRSGFTWCGARMRRSVGD